MPTEEGRRRCRRISAEVGICALARLVLLENQRSGTVGRSTNQPTFITEHNTSFYVSNGEQLGAAGLRRFQAPQRLELEDRELVRVTRRPDKKKKKKREREGRGGASSGGGRSSRAFCATPRWLAPRIGLVDFGGGRTSKHQNAGARTERPRAG